MTVPDLSMGAWVLLVVAAIAVGLAKTSIAGIGSLAVVIFALVLPARESTGALLPLLICADIVAIGKYRRHASGPTLARLLPGVVPGLLLGWWFMAEVGDSRMRQAIGLILVAMTLLQLWQRRSDGPDRTRAPQVWVTVLIGVAAGFVTMTANAAGPVATLYLIYAGMPMLGMIGTAAWFFFAVNVTKVPFSIGLGLISPASLVMDALLVPAMLVGALAGVLLIKRIDQEQFEKAALVLSGLSAGLLLL